MPTALGALLREVLRGEQLAAEFLGGTDVDQDHARLPKIPQHLIPQGPDRLVRLARRVAGRLDGRRIRDELAALVLPFLPAAIHQPHVRVAVVLEIPHEPGREPVVVVAIGHHRVLVADALRREQRLELLLGQQIADGTSLEILTPVQADCAFDVTRVIGGRVDVDLHDLDFRIATMIGDPLGVDENFGVRVARLGDLGSRFGHDPLLKLTNRIHKLNNEASQSTVGWPQRSSRSMAVSRARSQEGFG